MSPEPPAARLFSCFLYLAFLVLLVGMTVMGPFRRVMSKETKFYEGFKSTTELPAPTVTICLVKKCCTHIAFLLLTSMQAGRFYKKRHNF